MTARRNAIIGASALVAAGMMAAAAPSLTVQQPGARTQAPAPAQAGAVTPSKVLVVDHEQSATRIGWSRIGSRGRSGGNAPFRSDRKGYSPRKKAKRKARRRRMRAA